MGILNLFTAPVLTDQQRADVQRHATCVYEGGSRARPDWSGEPLAPAQDDTPAAAPVFNPDDPWSGYWDADGNYISHTP